MQRLTLAQQIAQLEDTAPADFDPEDIYERNTNDDTGPPNGDDVDVNTGDLNAGREHYVDVGPSKLRKLHDSIADPKYDGVKTSREQLHTDDSGNENEDVDGLSENDHINGVPSMRGDSWSSASEVEEDDEDSEAHSPVRDGDTESRTNPEVTGRQQDVTSTPQQETITSDLRRTRITDTLKGKAVSRQLKIWDSLVDARIRLQKSVTAANKLPHLENITPHVSSPAGRAAAREFLSEALQLSEELFELRHTLLAQAGSAQPPRKKRRVGTDEDDVDFKALVQESTAEMVALDAETHADTLSTLQKWSSKVQAVAPSALLPSSRVSFKSGPAHIKGAAELVGDALREQDKVVKRTWGKADQTLRIGGNARQRDDDNEGDEEAFDDRDFYQGILRDVIESKGGRDGIDAADLYANSKKQKKKKVVDTKASKGRKLRYEPHEKLQNLMVPVPVRGAWHEEQVDELFASLLGKGFEGDETMAVIERSEPVQKEWETPQGFRVFG